jgi:hypothetical protein
VCHRCRGTCLFFLLLLTLAGVVDGATPEYQALYDELTRDLKAWERRLPDSHTTRPPVWAAELLPANGNRGEDLLAPHALEGCILYLEALRRLGVQGVKIAIPYPLLDAACPRCEDYLSFYKRVAAAVRQRGMVLLVGTGAAFTDPNFSRVRVDYRRMTMAQFQAGRRRVARRIAQELRPDYLTVGSEPTTEAGITGYASLRNPARYEEMIRHILGGIPPGTTRTGAGTGNWESPAFVQRLAVLPGLDYIDLHVYPVGPEMIARAQAIAETARSGQKGLVIGEAWLYKVSATELAWTNPSRAFRRDVFSFWSPLDQQFLGVLARWARAEGAEFVSLFWSKYLFAYLDYDSTTARLPYNALRKRVDRRVLQNLETGQMSLTGRYYQTLIASSRQR